ncbi:prepilin peptidase [Rhizobiaceae bacterium CRRU44]|uniref:Prepilin peptidase n=1 Tax=Ferranicluibacter rubi TaxID=2715133 RepID=A0AA43ZBN0_9HYPH|nr:A24 family peptidase [Ferranicluibacter rubi]NHT74878.1 prepilin peptidase [Ferranicluibacter rubi]
MSRVMGRADLLALTVGIVVAAVVTAVPMPGVTAQAAAAFVIAAMIGWIAWQDLRTFTLPDGPLVALALTGAALRLSQAFDLPQEALVIAIDVVLCGGALLAIREGYYRWKGVDGLGFGDVKLAAACGVLVGVTGFAHALLAASAFGIAVVLALSLRSGAVAIDRLPFGALLAPACGLVWVLSSLT